MTGSNADLNAADGSNASSMVNLKAGLKDWSEGWLKDKLLGWLEGELERWLKGRLEC